MYGKSNCKEASNSIKDTSSRPLKKYYFTALFDFRTFVWPFESSSEKKHESADLVGLLEAKCHFNLSQHSTKSIEKKQN
jgi:hypothetical protein